MLPSGDSQSPLADLRKQVQELLAQQMFDSAELLAGVFVSVCREDVSSATNSGLQGVALEAYADALFGKGEYKRALVCPRNLRACGVEHWAQARVTELLQTSGAAAKAFRPPI
jgi:hypothetical protein